MTTIRETLDAASYYIDRRNHTYDPKHLLPPIRRSPWMDVDFGDAERTVMASRNMGKTAAFEMLKEPTFFGFDEWNKTLEKMAQRLYGVPSDLLKPCRYWPASTEDHPHMDDLTLTPLSGGKSYGVMNYDDDMLFGGTLDACTAFMGERMAETMRQRAKDEAEKAVQAAEAERVAAARQDRDKAVEAANMDFAKDCEQIRSSTRQALK